MHNLVDTLTIGLLKTVFPTNTSVAVASDVWLWRNAAGLKQIPTPIADYRHQAKLCDGRCDGITESAALHMYLNQMVTRLGGDRMGMSGLTWLCPHRRTFARRA